MSKRDVPRLNRDNFPAWKSLMISKTVILQRKCGMTYTLSMEEKNMFKEPNLRVSEFDDMRIE